MWRTTNTGAVCQKHLFQEKSKMMVSAECFVIIKVFLYVRSLLVKHVVVTEDVILDTGLLMEASSVWRLKPT
jgi:hypothetical protein